MSEMTSLTETLQGLVQKIGIGEQSCEPRYLTPEERLEENRIRTQDKVDDYNKSIGGSDMEDGYSCPLCLNRGYIASNELVEVCGAGSEYYTMILFPCKCQRKRRMVRALNHSGLKDVVRRLTLETYIDTERWQEALKTKFTAFQRGIGEGDTDWLFIGGQSGCGKSHLCSAVAIDSIRKDKTMRYMSWREDATALKGMITDAEAYESKMNEYKGVDVLYIDDLFKGKVTEADINLAFEIIDHRYCDRSKITIISSEKTISELMDIDMAISGRISERSKAKGYCISVNPDPKKNYRMKGVTEL